MTASSFVKPLDFEDMKRCVKSRDKFEFRAVVPCNGLEWSVRIDGHNIDKELAESIWHGHDYLVGFSSDYSGKGQYGGFGFATEKLDQFDSWENFKLWFDRAMKSRPGYEVEEVGQMVLF